MGNKRLASQKQKTILWQDSGGKCSVCGKFMEESEAHHIKPYAIGGDTNLTNLSLLCRDCHKKQHSNEEDWVPRKGQQELWEKLTDISTGTKHLAKLPTGYGKTIAAIGGFNVLRDRGVCYKALVLVPSDIQREQWVKSVSNSHQMTQKRLHPLLCSNKYWILREEQKNKADIFVATYQQLHADPGLYKDLTSRTKWLLVCDEAHHLSEVGMWGQSVEKLTPTITLYLSATPIRTDRQMIKGAPYKMSEDGKSWTFTPIVDVGWSQAFKERAIREPVGHIQHYFVDVETSQGVERITTESLLANKITDFEAYETKCQLRYNDKYLSKMIYDAIEMLYEKNSKQPNQHQMLVFCMTCKHAEFISGVMNNLAPVEGFSDWIGVNRNNKENDKIVKSYLKNKIQCLVQVNKAGEGFDNQESSVLLFLNLIKSVPKNIQQIGRGLRRNHSIENYNDDVCDIFASADTNIANTIRWMEEQFGPVKIKEDGGGGGGKWNTLPDLNLIDVEFEKTQEIFLPSHVEMTEEQRLMCQRIITEKKLNISPEEMWSSHILLSSKSQTTNTNTGKELTINGEREYVKAQVNLGVTTLTGSILKLLSKINTQQINGSFAGEIKRIIYGKLSWVAGASHDNSDADKLRIKYNWLQREQNRIAKERSLPSWLPKQFA